MQKRVDPGLAAREAEIQRKLAIEQQYKDYTRVIRVARPLLVASAEFCGEKVIPSAGVFVATSLDFEKENQQAARDYGLGDLPTVIAVANGSPADVAGLQVGDQLVALDGVPVAAGKKATETFVGRLRTALKTNGKVALRVQRSSKEVDLQLGSEMMCDYGVAVSPDETLNAYADGKNVVIHSGMLRFVESDQELSLILGHELAHNAMGHITAKRTNAAIGSVFDVLAAAYGVNTQGAFGNAGATAYSQAFESEADYVGMYVLGRAGVPTQGAANFWRRLGVASGNIKTSYGASHPGSAERFVALENAAVEVNQKREAGAPLVPNPKSKKH